MVFYKVLTVEAHRCNCAIQEENEENPHLK